MENNKLDKLFRNKLKNVKVPPPEGAWEAITEKLPNKKKQRVVMLWWSAAAILLALIGSSVFFWSNSNSDNQNIQLVDADKQSEISIEKQEYHSITTEKEDSDVANIKSTKEDPTSIEYPSSSTYNTTDSNAVADTYSQEKTTASKKTIENKPTADVLNRETKVTKGSIAKEQKVTMEKKKQEAYQKQKESRVAIGEEHINKEGKETLTEQIAQAEALEIEDKNTDTVIKQEVTSLVSSDNLFAAEEKEEAAKNEALNRWSVGPQVAPVYYNSVSSGSSLDSQFNDSGKEGGLNMSLGLQVAYQINDNWQLRSGINKMDVGYATNNVQVGYSDPNLAIYNVNYNNVSEGGVVITAFSNDNLSNIREANLGNRVELIYMEGNTQLKQNISYLEIPVEIERKIINADFEWSIIGGVSSLFLTDNEIYVNNKDYRSHIGSATNLQKTSFTTNIGMGFGYNFTKRIHLQLEPMFKYQLNAYTNSVDFKPYIFGIYTGVRWRLD